MKRIEGHIVIIVLLVGTIGFACYAVHWAFRGNEFATITDLVFAGAWTLAAIATRLGMESKK